MYVYIFLWILMLVLWILSFSDLEQSNMCNIGFANNILDAAFGRVLYMKFVIIIRIEKWENRGENILKVNRNQIKT